MTIAQQIAEVEATKAATLTELRTIAEGTSYPGSKPNAKGSEQLDHGEYETRLRNRIKWCDEELARLARLQGPSVTVNQGAIG